MDQKPLAERESVEAIMPLNSNEVSLSDFFSSQFFCVYDADMDVHLPGQP